MEWVFDGPLRNERHPKRFSFANASIVTDLNGEEDSSEEKKRPLGSLDTKPGCNYNVSNWHHPRIKG